MVEVRCKNCNKILAKANIMNAAIKCNRCKFIFEYKVYTNDVFSNLEEPKKQFTTQGEYIIVSTEAQEPKLRKWC